MRKIGINLYARKGLEMEEYIKTIKELGFDVTFCVMRPIEKMLEAADLLAKVGMSYETVHAPFRSASDIWFEGEASDEVYASLINSIDVCVQVGAPICVMHLTSGLTPPPPTDFGRGRYIQLVDYAIGKGVNIAFENTRTVAHLAWAFEEFKDTTSVGLCLDTGHEAAFTPGKQFLPIFGDRLMCTHIHDNDLLADQHILPFDGKIDFERIAKQIKESGYKGNLMLEVMGDKPLYENISDIAYLEKAAAAAKRLRDMVDGEQ